MNAMRVAVVVLAIIAASMIGYLVGMTQTAVLCVESRGADRQAERVEIDSMYDDIQTQFVKMDYALMAGEMYILAGRKSEALAVLRDGQKASARMFDLLHHNKQVQ